MNWYKKAQEFIGADAPLSSGQFIQDIRTRNVENQHLPSTISLRPVGEEMSSISSASKPTKCEKCGMPLESFEYLGYSFTENDGDKIEAYKCGNCGHKNHYNQSISRVKKKRNKGKRRSFNDSRLLVEAATPANNGFAGWPSGYNPANTPYGRLDLSEDQRVQTWKNMQDGFDNEFDSQKQKGNKKTKIVKVKGKDGQTKYVKVEDKTTGGDAVQPSNTFTQKGRIKKQRRYNPKDPNKTKENPGSWSHNRNFTGEGTGFYQSNYTEKLNADVRERYTDWYTYQNERLTSPGGMGKPF